MHQILIFTPGSKKLFDNLKPHKASGPDSIPPMVLKKLSNEIGPILQIIFQISLITRQDTRWLERSYNVAPIFKKSDKHKPSNYRSVSLTCITEKNMEHIIVNNLMKHLEIQNILYSLQHDYRQNHSCESQLFFPSFRTWPVVQPKQTCWLWILAKL